MSSRGNDSVKILLVRDDVAAELAKAILQLQDAVAAKELERNRTVDSLMRRRKALINRAIEMDKPAKVYPNDPCPCGSGKKYKKCCGMLR